MDHRCCIICLRPTDNGPNVFDNIFDTRNCSSQIICVYSRIFNVEEQKFVGNFNSENITFCTNCSMHVKKLIDLFEQLELIEKTIKRVVKETKVKILLSNIEKRRHNASRQVGNNPNDILIYDYFRNQAIKDLNPTVNLQRLASTAIATPKSDVDLQQSRKNVVKKGSKNFDDFEDLLLVKNDSNTEIHDVKTETIDDAEENIYESQENDQKGSLPLEKTVITRNLEDTAKTRTEEINKDSLDYGEENDADGDHLSYSEVESDISESETSVTDKKSYKDGIVSLKQKRLGRGWRKGVDYTLKNQPDSSTTYQCETCYKQFPNERYVQIHIRRLHLDGHVNVKLSADGKLLTPKDKLKRTFSAPIKLGGGKWSYKNFEYTKDSSSGKCICVCVTCGKMFDNRVCVKSVHQHINFVHGEYTKLNADGKPLTKRGKVKTIFSCKSIPLGGGKWSYKNFKYTKDSSNGKCRCVCDSCGKIFDNGKSVTSILQHINTFHGANDKVTADGKVITQKGKVKRFSSRAVDLGGGKWSFKNFGYTKDSSSGKCICVCDSCGNIFDKRRCIQSVHQHINIAHVARLNLDHLKKFTAKGKLRKPHLSIKLDGGEWWCSNGMKYRTEKDPEDTKKQLYHCAQCDYVCATHNSIKRHISLKHLNPGSRMCYICDEIFPSKSSYDQHALSHNNSKNATCEECGETFKYRSALYPHIRRVHLGERPYICEFCGKRFFTRKDCRVHSATHNNDNKNMKSKKDTPKIQNEDSSNPVY